jgi:hypothetical protein
MIDELIYKQDGVEVVRDQIAVLLATETANQMQLAADAGLDPSEWKLRIFTERANPWDSWREDQPVDSSPIVNVALDNATYDRQGSTVFERQKTEAVYHIDCYGYGRSGGVLGGGHAPGDREAAYEVQRALRLVRNILMAAENTLLGLQVLVWDRWPLSITVFQPPAEAAHSVQHVVGGRLALQVTLNELSPQVHPAVLEYVALTVYRKEDGEVVLRVEKDYTD